jgi:TPR repeat protein
MKELDKREGRLDLGTELDIGLLEKLPPQEECPICLRVLPLHPKLSTYVTCCGKTLCGGCEFQHKIKRLEQAAEEGQKLVPPMCAFCRTTAPKDDEEILLRLRKRVEHEDPQAMRNLAGVYSNGRYGLRVDQAKCIDLIRQSAGLGYPPAQYQLGHFYCTGKMGFEQNQEEAFKYFEKAAEGGDLISRHILGDIEFGNGDYVAAMRHWRLSASGGRRSSMEGLITCFEDGLLHHADLAETLLAMYRARAEMKSEDRNQYIAYLKRTGQYNEEYAL